MPGGQEHELLGDAAPAEGAGHRRAQLSSACAGSYCRIARIAACKRTCASAAPRVPLTALLHPCQLRMRSTARCTAAILHLCQLRMRLTARCTAAIHLVPPARTSARRSRPGPPRSRCSPTPGAARTEPRARLWRAARAVLVLGPGTACGTRGEEEGGARMRVHALLRCGRGRAGAGVCVQQPRGRIRVARSAGVRARTYHHAPPRTRPPPMQDAPSPAAVRAARTPPLPAPITIRSWSYAPASGAPDDAAILVERRLSGWGCEEWM